MTRLSAAAVADDRQPRVSAPSAGLRVRAENSRLPFAKRTPPADRPGDDARIHFQQPARRLVDDEEESS
jgi:hypothetical protein